MDARDRPPGPYGWTAAESQSRGSRRQELKEQRLFATELGRRDILFIRARPDKKSTIRTGAPDFSIFLNGGLTLFLEFKAMGAKQSDEQIEFMNAARSAGHRYEVVYSCLEAIGLLRELVSSNS